MLRRVVFAAVVASTTSTGGASAGDDAIAADAAALLDDVCGHFVAAFRAARRGSPWSDGVGANPILIFAILMSAVAHRCAEVNLAARVGTRASNAGT